MAEIRRLGFRWVRIQADWIQIQPKAGQFDWTLSDGLVAAARRQGLSILCTLGNTPRWASVYAAQVDPDTWMRNPPRDMSDWKTFVSAVTRRYQRDVASWQLWERLDVHYYRGHGQEMAEMLGILSGVTRALDGSRHVVLPEVGPIRLCPLQRYFRPQTVDRFDIVGLSPAFATPEQMLRPLGVLDTEIVQKSAPAKQVWISSLGWNVEPVPGPLREPVVSEAEQARYLVRGTVLALSHGVRRVFWKTYRDVVEGPYQAQSHSGLLRADGSPRPSLQACRTLLSQLEGRHFTKAAAWGPHLHGYLFDGERGSLMVVWADREASTLAVSGQGATVTDLQGRQAPTGSRLELTAEPLFVEGSTLTLGSLLAAIPAPMPSLDPDFSTVAEVSATLGLTPQEHGLNALRYRPVETKAVTVVERAGATAWSTQIALKKTEVLFDVDDSFLYFVNGHWDVDVEVEVYAASAAERAGFNLGYDSVRGYGFTSWQWIEAGQGWRKYTFPISNASFSDHFSDFRINALGSKEDVVVRSVTVRKRPHANTGVVTP